MMSRLKFTMVRQLKQKVGQGSIARNFGSEIIFRKSVRDYGSNSDTKLKAQTT